MLSPDARAGKERIFSTAVRPKIEKKVTLDEDSNSGPPTAIFMVHNNDANNAAANADDDADNTDGF